MPASSNTLKRRIAAIEQQAKEVTTAFGGVLEYVQTFESAADAAARAPAPGTYLLIETTSDAGTLCQVFRDGSFELTERIHAQ